MRWKLLPSKYDFKVIYKAGAKNVNTDALSRNPVIAAISKSEISPSRKERILKEMHVCPVGGHQGINPTYERLKLYVNCDNIFNDVVDYIKNCIVCAKLKGNETRLVLQETDMPKNAWDKIALDLVRPMVRSNKDYKYILTCQDLLTKYIVMAPLRGITAEEVADKLIKHIVLKYGIPLEILTDQSLHFMSESFKELAKLLHVKHVHCSVYHPQSNGSLERSHKVLVDYLRAFCEKKYDSPIGLISQHLHIIPRLTLLQSTHHSSYCIVG